MSNDDFEYSNESEEDMGQLHAIHNNMNHIADVNRQLAEQAKKPSAKECQECGEEIPEGRRISVPGVQYCVACQEYFEIKGRTVRK